MPTENDVERELVLEQEYVNALYGRLDALREQAARGCESEDPEAAARWQAELARLQAVEDGLCFGRLEMHDGSRTYIGRLGLFQDGADEPLLLDWRAPAAQPFYTATMAEAHGVRERRRITTRGRVVTALDDELLDPDVADAGTLVGEAALMAALTADRTGRMGDIVTTLQVEQDRIVRDGYSGVLVVQGGPGTGKTAVALHRLAYLMYTRPQLRTRGVLVIGPSDVFLDYIGQVLPGLGEQAVVTATVARLRPDVEVSRVDPVEVAEAKGRAEAAERIAAAVWGRAGASGEAVEVEFEQQRVRLESSEWRGAVESAVGTGLPYQQARLVFQQRMVELFAQRLADQMENVVFTESGAAIDGGSADGRLGAADLRALAAAGVVLGPEQDDGPRRLLDEVDLADLRKALLADVAVCGVLDELWPALTAEAVVAEVFGETGAAAKIDYAPRTAASFGEGWSAADIPLLDEAAAVLGEPTGTFGHVVVDEAQELSVMAWRMVMRRCPAKSMTVVGDLAQTSDPAGAASWEQVLGPHVADRWRLAELTVNYRTPVEIMAAASELFGAQHPDLQPPRSVRAAGESPWRQQGTLAEVGAIAGEHRRGQLAIIAPASHLAELREGCAATVLTPGEAKGLEFDSVLIVDPARILDAPLGRNDLYVAMTRATRRLGIVHCGPVPDELAGIRERGQ
ncbi:HelD family protein [Amycolatopsis circi]|uniref:HelD family protein n=1 Tax=Amycolatopsis circi TaxID=871959 RepID=UPI000E2419D2|nr:ATP-binding domain-containing protein [Amycolatopsis circi]